MKYALAIAATLVVAFGASARADDTAFADNHVGQQMLAEMGLSGITVISDAEGMEIRGEGYSLATSLAAAALFTSVTVNRALGFGTFRANANTGAITTVELEKSFTVFGIPVVFPFQSFSGSGGFASATTN